MNQTDRGAGGAGGMDMSALAGMMGGTTLFPSLFSCFLRLHFHLHYNLYFYLRHYFYCHPYYLPCNLHI